MAAAIEKTMKAKIVTLRNEMPDSPAVARLAPVSTVCRPMTVLLITTVTTMVNRKKTQTSIGSPIGSESPHEV
jgi:hypothetical protein